MIKRRALLQASALTLAAPRLAGAQAGQKLLRFAPQADLAILDPIVTTGFVTRNHAFLVFDTLYGWDEQYRAQPQMVAGHTVADDGADLDDDPARGPALPRRRAGAGRGMRSPASSAGGSGTASASPSWR